jgi:hypothetical protein
MLAAGLLGATPDPSASPLKTIIEVHSSVLCQTLHQAVQPALTGLIKNDNLLDVGNRAFAKMFEDQAAGATHSGEQDRLFLRNVAGALTHNLNVVSDLLGHGFPQDADATTHAAEELMKVRLQAVASAQNDALNLIEGYLQTEDMGRARDEFPGGHQSGANEVEGPGPFGDQSGFLAEFHNANDPTTPYVDIAGLNGTMLHGVDGKQAQAAPVSLLQLTRTRIANLEEPAGTAIVAAVQVCSQPKPSP